MVNTSVATSTVSQNLVPVRSAFCVAKIIEAFEREFDDKDEMISAEANYNHQQVLDSVRHKPRGATIVLLFPEI